MYVWEFCVDKETASHSRLFDDENGMIHVYKTLKILEVRISFSQQANIFGVLIDYSHTNYFVIRSKTGEFSGIMKDGGIVP